MIRVATGTFINKDVAPVHCVYTEAMSDCCKLLQLSGLQLCRSDFALADIVHALGNDEIVKVADGFFASRQFLASVACIDQQSPKSYIITLQNGAELWLQSVTGLDALIARVSEALL